MGIGMGIDAYCCMEVCMSLLSRPLCDTRHPSLLVARWL